MVSANFYLPEGLPIPLPEADGLSAPYWDGLRNGQLLTQRCDHCGTWQFGAEWICHHCHEFDPPWTQVDAKGLIYSWERVWHPSHPCLRGHCPYLVVLVELPHAGGIRMLGNLLGDPMQDVRIGTAVEGVFEHHPNINPPYSLMQWKIASKANPQGR
ncbi:Zn-ribbon domain-containing OB-fold protein [Noviherbaspirillum pedocola]|uniref:OB-fold domain-containing protein n=1 Tax=Noviherbaspirillum pedocola TaxID=2801341 RepID=A0A934T040_9BURK|nr:OB-fold domain-containing protein [Noviherbaspirillum pedocola]MBK4739023.1 OB-fold domain-containing protein [Noviherbaspirillum pedocola]